MVILVTQNKRRNNAKEMRFFTWNVYEIMQITTRSIEKQNKTTKTKHVNLASFILKQLKTFDAKLSELWRGTSKCMYYMCIAYVCSHVYAYVKLCILFCVQIYLKTMSRNINRFSTVEISFFSNFLCYMPHKIYCNC